MVARQYSASAAPRNRKRKLPTRTMASRVMAVDIGEDGGIAAAGLDNGAGGRGPGTATGTHPGETAPLPPGFKINGPSLFVTPDGPIEIQTVIEKTPDPKP